MHYSKLCLSFFADPDRLFNPLNYKHLQLSPTKRVTFDELALTSKLFTKLNDQFLLDMKCDKIKTGDFSREQSMRERYVLALLLVSVLFTTLTLCTE